MKKSILLTGIMMFVAVNAFATTLAVPAAVSPGGFSASKNVIVGYGSGDATGAACATTTCVHFGASAKNTAGDKIYGAVDTQSSVYMSSSTAGKTLTELTTTVLMPIPTAGDYAPGAGWTAM